MGHGRKFKQIRLCADFSAGPSKEYSLLFLLAQVRAINIKLLFYFFTFCNMFLDLHLTTDHLGFRF